MSAPASTIQPLWSAPLSGDSGGFLLIDEADRCLVASGAALAAYGADGRRLWETPASGRAYKPPTLLPGGRVARIESDRVVVLDTGSGTVLGSFAAPLSTSLVTTPWGDLAFCEAVPGTGALLRCVDPDGVARWALPLREPLWHPPFPLGELLVVNRDGGLHAIDRDGRTRWVVDHTAAFPAAGRGDEPTGAGDELRSRPAHVDADRVLLELAWHTGIRFVRLDAGGRMEPFGTPVPILPPYTIVPWPPSGHRVAAQGPREEVLRQQWEYAVVMLEPGGARLWEHRMHVRPQVLVAGTAGTVIAAATPTRKRWNEYHHWQNLSDSTFVRCLASDGSERWTWYAPGPQTHLPVVGPGGVVYAGSEGRLWALAVDDGSGGAGQRPGGPGAAGDSGVDLPLSSIRRGLSPDAGPAHPSTGQDTR